MTQLIKAPEEMKILIEKLDRGEITWDDISQGIEKIRIQNAKQRNRVDIPNVN